MSNILIIDDDVLFSRLISRRVTKLGHATREAHILEDGLKEASADAFDIVFLDVRLPDGNGLDALPILQQTLSSPEVIIMTGAGDPDGAELAIKNGAWDYIEKPSSSEAMILSFIRALQYREEKRARGPKHGEGGGIVALKREGIIGNSPPVNRCLDLVAQASSSHANVLLIGETGTGKELFAQAIHNNSSRARKSFVVVDCTALPQGLVESILFGHEKGAFTGADRHMEGLIRQADGGTLFLDEVGELPLGVQKSFLRVLQEHRFRPLGGDREIESHFRLIAATNRNLNEMVSTGLFRRDLLFRLHSIAIELPPLRERREDIKELAIYYMNRFCERYGTETKGFSPDYFEALMAYDWPGNVRELVNTMETTFAAAGHAPTLFSRHLPAQIRIWLARDAIEKKPPSPKNPLGPPDAHASSTGLPTLRDYREALELRYLQDLISTSGGNVEEACRISALSRSRLYELMKKYGLSLTQ